jgi:hypothetical protein
MSIEAASVPTDKGFLCAPVRINNAHSFLVTKAGFVLRKIDQKFSPKIFNRIFLNQNKDLSFSLHNYLTLNPLLVPGMRTRSLYKPQRLTELINEAIQSKYPYQKFLSRIIAIERFYEATGTGLP